MIDCCVIRRQSSSVVSRHSRIPIRVTYRRDLESNLNDLVMLYVLRFDSKDRKPEAPAARARRCLQMFFRFVVIFAFRRRRSHRHWQTTDPAGKSCSHHHHNNSRLDQNIHLTMLFSSLTRASRPMMRAAQRAPLSQQRAMMSTKTFDLTGSFQVRWMDGNSSVEASYLSLVSSSHPFFIYYLHLYRLTISILLPAMKSNARKKTCWQCSNSCTRCVAWKSLATTSTKPEPFVDSATCTMAKKPSLLGFTTLFPSRILG
jgi:hypothetical protein